MTPESDGTPGLCDRPEATARGRRPGGPDTLARAATGLLAPAQTAAYVVGVTAWWSAPSPAAALLWGAQAVLFAAVVPAVFIAAGVRLGWWRDRHVREQSKRRWPLLVCVVSVAAGTVTGHLFDGPPDLVALGAVLCTAALLMLTSTELFRTKPSVHTFVAATAAGITAVYFGLPGAAVSLPLAALIAWSRIRLRHHTPPQVLAGALIGAGAAVAFAFVR